MPNDRELANLSLQFLNRVQLNGSEAPALIAVCDLLRRLADGSHRVVAIGEPSAE